MDVIEIIRQNVKLRAAHLGRSMADLCQADEVDAKSVSGWLAHGNPQLSSLVTIAGVIRVPVHTLLDPTFDPKAHPIVAAEQVVF